MGKNSAIEWTDNTFNPWWGCIKVSPGCSNCYAERLANRYAEGTWGPVATSRRLTFGEKHWAEPLKWNRDAEVNGKRKRVFCLSMGDVFEDHPALSPLRDRLWSLIEQTQWLDWQLLTKRPENIRAFLPDRWLLDFPQNVWMGVSAENQEMFNMRWPILDSETHGLNVPVLFISLEPLLGPINLEIALSEDDLGDEEHTWWTRMADWVIVGGESGPRSRSIQKEWVLSIRNQCVEAGVLFFFKQWGGVNKRRTGRLLENMTWDELPAIERVEPKDRT